MFFVAESETHSCRTTGQKNPAVSRVCGSHRRPGLRPESRQAVDQADSRWQGTHWVCHLQRALYRLSKSIQQFSLQWFPFHILLASSLMKSTSFSRPSLSCHFIQAAIRKELNDYKSTEMEVHEESRIYTRFTFCSYTLGQGLLVRTGGYGANRKSWAQSYTEMQTIVVNTLCPAAEIQQKKMLSQNMNVCLCLTASLCFRFHRP